MAPEAAHMRWWQTFEVVFGIPFLLALALQFVLPLSFGDGIVALVRVLVGAVLLVGGILVIGAARRQFRSHHQPTDPGQPTSTLITSGVFARSRNPLYLGGVGLLGGLALVLNVGWGLIVLLPALVAAHVVLILPEERYLAATFGEEYRTYTATVCRWIGRTR
jgi:protein-S-isoprenylcysteine O-methyltransferase Ste14